jgi:hypothetical protein
MSSKGILRAYCSTALGLAGHELIALMVPVGEGMGDTKGEVRVVSILRGCVMGEMGGGRRGGISSIREVRASLIWVDGNLMMQLQKRGSVSKSVQERVSETRHRPSRVFLTHEFGNCSLLFSLFWNMSSTKTPFFPRHTRYSWFRSISMSRWRREMNREFPMFTSTPPSLLLRPIVILLLSIVNSKSLPSSRAYAVSMLFLNSPHLVRSFVFVYKPVARGSPRDIKES